MDFAYQLLKGEFNSIIPLSYIFWGIIFAVLISVVSFLTKYSKRESQRLDLPKPEYSNVGLYEERMKNVL